jgi:hypothetical protein
MTVTVGRTRLVDVPMAKIRLIVTVESRDAR